jgi:hypothetical protein
MAPGVNVVKFLSPLGYFVFYVRNDSTDKQIKWMNEKVTAFGGAKNCEFNPVACEMENEGNK